MAESDRTVSFAPLAQLRAGRQHGGMIRIGFWLFPGVEELDVAGPWEVLGSWAVDHPGDVVEVFSFAREAGPLRCRNGLQLVPDLVWADGEDPPACDVVLVPGGEGNRPLVGRPWVRDALRGWHAGGTLVTSVCSGALLLADAGLLDGRAATTHWSVTDVLAGLGTGVEVREDERFVDLGDVVTSAGVSAGIDMALHLVARLASPDRARQVRREIQYDPAPPV
jgi:transcriptional regulator GlxA family with amidase domain